MISKTIRLLLPVVVSTIATLMVCELVLRIFFPVSESRYVWQPRLHHVFTPANGVLPGISGEKNFSINEFGFRGPAFKEGKKNYLCIGGSTSECLYLDDNETWFARLQQQLNTQNDHYRIGSIGKSGCTSVENYLHLKYYVPQLNHVTGVVMMIGLNDAMKFLSTGTVPALHNEDSLVRTIFWQSFSQGQAFYKRTALYRLYQQMLYKTKHVQWETVQDEHALAYVRWRSYRREAPAMIDTVPALQTALDSFAQHLEWIYREAANQRLPLVLVTQATLYKQSLSPAENELLWMGGVGDFQLGRAKAYYTLGVLETVTEAYNNTLRSFCKQHPDVFLIDLATKLPKDTTVFYDDCHFNTSGAVKVANVLYQFWPVQ